MVYIKPVILRLNGKDDWHSVMDESDVLRRLPRQDGEHRLSVLRKGYRDSILHTFHVETVALMTRTDAGKG